MLAVHLLQHYAACKYTLRECMGALPNSQLRQVTDYINTHLDQDLGLAELAELVQMSSSHFGRLFKQSTGQTPYQYMIERRLERAKSLLANTDLTIAEIADCTGFASQSHLTTLFRKHLLTTPKAYRRQIL